MSKCKPIAKVESCKCGYIMKLRVEGALRISGNISWTCPSCKLINSMSMI